MWRLSYSLALLSVTFTVTCARTLTFVIDSTNSMMDDINLVRDVADSLLDIFGDNESDYPISNMLLLTFNDPEGSMVRANTTKRPEMNEALGKLTVRGGGDCSELSLSGVKLALELSQPGSYIYVFTDASAKDYILNEEIQQLCQRTQSQVVFIIAVTGYCGLLHSQEFEVYYNITTASWGLALRAPMNEIESVVEKFVQEDIADEKINLIAQLTPPNVKTKVTFTIDDLTQYAIVSASGTDIILNHFAGPSIKLEPVIFTKHAKVIKFLNTNPGDYSVVVRSSSPTSVVITGRSDFYFRHGFSDRKPKSMNETHPVPFSDTLSRISIAVTDPKYSVKLLKVQILELNESLIMELNIEELSLNFYTTEMFIVPSHIFKVALVGEVLQTQNPIRRIARIPVMPQPQPLEAPKILGVKIQEVRVGASVSVKCNVVKGVPKPTLRWQFKPANGNEYADMNNNGSELHLRNVTGENSGDYKCTATNSEGTAEHVIHLNAKEPAITSGDKTLRLPCDTFSYPKPSVRWEVNGSLITPGNKYCIDDGDLIINNPTPSDNYNTYTCTASRTFNAVINGNSTDYGTRQNVYLLQNRSLKLTCSLPRNGPSPITWYKDGVDIGDDKPDINVENAQAGDDGNYTCHVCDVNGSTTKSFIVDVGYPPSFKFYQNEVVEWTKGIRLLLRCDALAKPPATVEWTLNGAPVVNEHSMQLAIANFGKYECIVSNVHGSLRRSFEVVTSEFSKK